MDYLFIFFEIRILCNQAPNVVEWQTDFIHVNPLNIYFNVLIEYGNDQPTKHNAPT